MADEQPFKATLRTYQVGFGDCFLLTFEYKTLGKRHVLIDFGSTGLPESAPKDQMLRVAKNIKEYCGEQGLDIVVATHRHKDHISGFNTEGDGETTTGKIIQECKPKMVLQPWTENPALESNATGALAGIPGSDDASKALHISYAQSLHNMNRISEEVEVEVTRLADPKKFNKTLPRAMVDQLNFLAVDNGIRNASAVENLNKGMGGKCQYLKYGDGIDDLNKILPGVNIKVLGPPTLEQYEKIKRQKSSDENEFWMLAAATAETSGKLREVTDSEEPNDALFPDADAGDGAGVYREIPASCRWFVRKLRVLRADQLLQIVRILDSSMNNTSLILLFEAGNQKLLFPGDAQIENWEYALSHAPDFNKNLELLKQTTLYKVGHHGSRNATPKSLWNTFMKRNADTNKADRLRTVVSTMLGKHGNIDRHTEVPRQTLVDALSGMSNFYSTQDLEPHSEEEKEESTKFSDKEIGLWGEISVDIK